MAEKATITDVARYANVSRQTVSNVLNSPGLVREETRNRVHEAVKALGYRVNQAARQMRTGRSRIIATRIEPDRDGINGSVFDRFLHSLTASAAQAGYRILLYTADDERSEFATFDDLIGAYEPDAFVLTNTFHRDGRPSWLGERGVPFVTFGRPWDGTGGVHGAAHSWVDVDGAAGTAEATRHLLDTGHRRIGFLGWPAGSGVGDDRRSGWSRTLAAAGVDPTGLDRATADGVADGEAAARDLLDAGHPVTALVCASDSLALGALNAVRLMKTGERPDAPPPVVIGFDDTPVAKAVGLSSVSQPLAEAAAGCVSLLTRLFDSAPSRPPEPAAPPAHLLLQPSLVVRGSA
ncbi:LacI family DNA-binding transcriptional regulator [Streptosporangium sp. NPDC087985]|uniref:LacI family DNA-binding transcriptional regulator n=1 Tax=Streptosporangium sp. NPDC087985 TaxID=3366196 RepID=UPI003802D3B6